VAEGVEGLFVGGALGVASVAEEYAFGVGDYGPSRVAVLGDAGVVVRGGVVGEVAVEGADEAAGGVGVAEEDFGKRGAAFLAEVPAMEDGGDFFIPVDDGDAGAAVEGDDGAGFAAARARMVWGWEPGRVKERSRSSPSSEGVNPAQ